eukprot:COSAG02_NODE_31938_length_525_cov_0.483568_1_plen_94_part_00
MGSGQEEEERKAPAAAEDAGRIASARHRTVRGADCVWRGAAGIVDIMEAQAAGDYIGGRGSPLPAVAAAEASAVLVKDGCVRCARLLSPDVCI